MSLLVVGTLAYDTIETPSGRADDVLGGAATYCAIAASFFVPVRLVGVVGEDFKPEHRTLLTKHGVLLDGLKEAPGKSFRWSGRYMDDLNVAETVDTNSTSWTAGSRPSPRSSARAWAPLPNGFLRRGRRSRAGLQ